MTSIFWFCYHPPHTTFTLDTGKINCIELEASLNAVAWNAHMSIHNAIYIVAIGILLLMVALSVLGINLIMSLNSNTLQY